AETGARFLDNVTEIVFKHATIIGKRPCAINVDIDVMGAGRYRLKHSGATCMAEADKQKGRIFLHRGDLAQARACYEQALKDDRQDDSAQPLSDTLGNLGNVCA